MENEVLKKGLSDCYMKGTPLVVAYIVITWIKTIFFTHKEHHGAIFELDKITWSLGRIPSMPLVSD